MSFVVDQIVELTIESLAHGGAGVARLNDFVFFTPYTAPGDKIKAQITSIKKNYADAKLIELQTASSHRVQAPCSVYGKCGGCQWQHVNYATQLDQKQKTVEHALARIAKENDFELKKIIPSPNEFFYRNRAQVRTHGQKLGFYKRGSHELIEFDECHILEKSLNEEIKKIKVEIKNFDEFKTSKIEVFLSQNNKVVRSANQGHGEEFGFSQVNTLQNKNLQQLVAQAFGTPQSVEDNILELFCGNGNFTIPLAQQGWDIYAVDLNRSAINQARLQATSKTFFSCNDCSFEVRKLINKNRKFKNILLDPPRVGCDEDLTKNISKLDAQKLIYISCNPTTFARDWARIKNNSDFKLISVQPLDMFPQTFHVELIATAIRQ